MASDRDTLAALIRSEYVTRPEGARPAPRVLAGAILAAGWRPPAQVIETAEDLAAVERGTIVHNSDGTIACRFDEQYGVVFGDDRPFPWSILTPPVFVVWSPTEKAGQ